MISDETPISDELARWMSASDGKLELTTSEIRRVGLELITLRRRVADLQSIIDELRSRYLP
jgi:hypothetical protein